MAVRPEVPDLMTGLVPTTASGTATWAPRRLPVPAPGPGQLLVRAETAALNNADVPALDAAGGQDEAAGLDAVPGYEVAGVVVAVGEGDDPSRVGSPVMASTTHAFAEYVVAEDRHALTVPDGVGWEQAAALPTALLTEHGALRAGGFARGQSVLVLGATSAIGLVGLAVARELGAAQVLGAARTSESADLLRAQGADEVVATGETGLPEAVAEATGGRGVDLVLDHVGGEGFADAVASVRSGGTLVQVGRLAGASAVVDLDDLAYRGITVRGVSFGAPDELADLLEGARAALMPAVAAGRVRPVVGAVVDLADPGEAIALVREGRARGKVVLRIA